jgi:hypothetical protein
MQPEWFYIGHKWETDRRPHFGLVPDTVIAAEYLRLVNLGPDAGPTRVVLL